MAKMTRAEWIEATIARAPEGAAERFFTRLYQIALSQPAESPSPVEQTGKGEAS